MKSYNRYIFKQLSMAMLFVSFCLTCAIWLTQSLRYIELIVKHGISLGTFLYLTLLLLPGFLAIVLPVGLFSSILFTYNKLWMDRELVVLRSVGVSQIALAAPALLMAAIITFFSYTLNLYFMPVAYGSFKDLEFAIKNDFSAILLQEGKFNTLGENLTIYIRQRQPDGELLGILVQDARVPSRPVTYVAERGAVVASPTGPRVVLFNGNRQAAERTDGRLAFLYFDKYSVDLDYLSSGMQPRWRRADERFLGELLHPDMSNPDDRLNAARFLVEANQRLASPWYAFTFALIALAALLSGDFNRQGQTIRVIVAVSCVVLLESISIGSQSLAAKEIYLLPILYLNCFIPLFAALRYLLRPPRRHPPAYEPQSEGSLAQGS
ncbi:MAG TPA: LPS export ABC transporter permease LptF [Alphaproteobacteria bacterium]|nr:LPS export ABC transporter permease LptF [Alphaproteobacteria bacterium]